MDTPDLLRHCVNTLEALRLGYYVTGSVASSSYGEPRSTNDIDVVVELSADKIPALFAAFPEADFYRSLPAAQDAVARRSQFNILHPGSGLKIDVIIASDSPYDRSRMQRRRLLPVMKDLSVVVASAEDVLLMKLVYYQEGGSDKHMRDCRGILIIQGDKLDRAYIVEWAAKLGVLDEWQELLATLPKK